MTTSTPRTDASPADASPPRNSPHAASGRPAPDGAGRAGRRWWALGALALAQFLVVLDASIVNIAIPSIGSDVGLDSAALAWVITAYVLPFGSLLLLGGRLADRFGHRTVFITGVAGFVAASAFAALSSEGWMLLTARAVQGGAAALLAPAALALVTRLFADGRERARALGIWGAVAGAGSAAGVLLGGVLTAAFGWQAVFVVNVPIGIAVVVAIPALIARDMPGERSPLDLGGVLTATGALVALTVGLTGAERFGAGHPFAIVPLAAAALLAVAFFLIERRVARPLVPLGIFRNRAVATGNLVMLLLGGAMVALFYALSVFLQEVLDLDALGAGLSQLPLALALVAVAGVVPSLVARFGTRNVLAASLLVFAAGSAWLAAAPADADFPVHVLGPTVLIGIGLGGAFVTATELAVHGVAGGEAGLAGGLVNTSQQVGGAVGFAVLATLANARSTALAESGAGVAESSAGGFAVVMLGAAVLAVAGAIVALALRGREARR